MAWQAAAAGHSVTIRVSKQRPSTRHRNSPTGPARPPLPIDSVAFWRGRVFRNSYTREGRTLRVKGWSVKLQHKGKRRTFSLAAASRAEAAKQAQSLYQIIRAEGWDAATQAQGRAARSLALRAWKANRGQWPESDARYWRERLIRRKYSEARRTRIPELSVRMEHEGIYHYFPLGTDDQERATAQALKIYQTIVSKGWEAAFQQFSREITVAIFWSPSPVACTYTTLFTFTGETEPDLAAAQDRARPGKKVFLLEADPEVRRTLIFWLSRQPGFDCAVAPESVGEAKDAIARERPDLLLVNRALPETPFVEFLDRLKGHAPDLPAFMYGIYQDSDQIFITLSGVTAGYIFRRREPTDLFEPIRATLRHQALSAKEVWLQIRDYFQSLFQFTGAGQETPGLTRLTAREQEILNYVSKGFLDKEIAGALRISIWTVHNHLKQVYKKLNVHTRTEAVMKYLQK